MTKIIVRGDSYEANRPLFIYTFVNDEGGPLDLRGYTIRTTYKAAVTTPADDPDDDAAPIKHEIKIDVAGNVTTSEGLVLEDNDPSLGVVIEHLTAQESNSLPIGVTLLSDVELQNANDQFTSFTMEEGIQAKDGYTNRGYTEVHG